jgi:hypothetical protein
MQRALDEAGRSLSSFGRELIANRAQCEAHELADAIKRWRDDGHTHASFSTMGRGFAKVEQHLDFATQVKDLVG